MVGRDPFAKTADVVSLKENLRTAVCRAKLTENKRVSTWRCPANAQGRYIRVQLEKFSTLSVAEIEVFGYWGISRGVGRVSFATAGRDVTVAVVRPSPDPRDVEFLYKRAAYADSGNADILRQYETFTLEYDKFGRGEVLQKECCICKGLDKCESCILYETFSREIARMPPVIGGRRRRLKSISDFLISQNKPELQPVIVPKSVRPTKFQLRMESWFGNMRLKWGLPRIFRPAHANYITPKEALDRDPEAMMTQLKYIQRLDEEKVAEKQEQHKTGAITMTDVNHAALVDQNEDLDSFVESTEVDDRFQTELSVSVSDANLNGESVDPDASLGSSKIHSVKRLSKASAKATKHGYTEKNQPIQVGDILPTGHVVKNAYPKSIAEQIGESYDANLLWAKKKEEEQKAKEAEREAKKARLALKRINHAAKNSAK
jgi:hypothetical protein